MLIELELFKSEQFNNLLMSKLSAIPISEKAECLAIQKVKARLIKDSFINEGSIVRQAHVAKQVIRYTTLLSEKMLDKITTQQVRQFQNNVQAYCKESNKQTQFKLVKVSQPKQINVSLFLNNYKNQTKTSIINKKKRRRASQSAQLQAVPSKEIHDGPLDQQNKNQLPFDISKIKDGSYCSKSRASKFHVNGRSVNSQIISLIQKLDQIETIEQLRRRRQGLHQDEDVGHTRQLKKEQERLSTALENQQRSRFKPLGKIKKDVRYSSQRSDVKLDEKDILMKMDKRASRAISLKPLNKSEATIHSRLPSKASIHPEDGLPSQIKNKLQQNTKRSEGFIPIHEQRYNPNMHHNTQGTSIQKDMFLGCIYE